jgi:MoxR-like ATPase
LNTRIKEIKKEISKTVIGQEKLINGILIGLFTNGHILVEGVPGLAKTTTINAVAETMGLNFKRIQFTPDLMPSDITGSEIYNQKTGNFDIRKGPVFTNLLLADEINRAPSKVQSALLEVMQEKQVTIGDETHKLDLPFVVLATQNPIEQEGAYKLPEAQLDRFMMNIIVSYNTIDEEFEVVKRVANNTFEKINQIIDKEELLKISEEVKNIHIDDALVKYMLKIIFVTRNPEEYNAEKIKDYIQYGVSPRASIDLFKASKANAYIKGKDFVEPDDILEVLEEVLSHRMVLTYEAEANNITPKKIINHIVKQIPIP